MSILHAGPRAVASEQARESFFSSLSRELRWSLDDDERFLLLEGAWQSVLGWRPERLHGWHWQEIVHPADRPRVAEALEQLSAGDLARDVAVRVSMATGGYHVMEWTLATGSGVDSVLGLGHEPAGHPELERRNAELAARVAQLEDQYAAVEQFAGTAAHQLAEPLVIAESSAIMVADELGPALDPMLRDRLEAVGRGASRARVFMDTLLADARSSSEPPTLVPVSLNLVVRDAIAALEPRIEELGAEVVVASLPSALGDYALLSIVVENLLVNALKHGARHGTVRVDADRTATGQRLSVWSDGVPIAAANLAGIFEPFRRLPGERRVTGAGLGLTICSRLMHRMGGGIGVQPGRDRGNAFWIRLPVVD